MPAKKAEANAIAAVNYGQVTFLPSQLDDTALQHARQLLPGSMSANIANFNTNYFEDQLCSNELRFPVLDSSLSVPIYGGDSSYPINIPTEACSEWNIIDTMGQGRQASGLVDNATTEKSPYHSYLLESDTVQACIDPALLCLDRLAGPRWFMQRQSGNRWH